MANGTHTLSARARDAVGNTALATPVSVTVSNTQPLGLVAAYGFNEGSGTSVADVSGNNNTGTLTSGASWSTQGKFGNALSFNGSSGRVDIADAPSLRLTNAMTLEAWVNPTTATAAAPWLARRALQGQRQLLPRGGLHTWVPRPRWSGTFGEAGAASAAAPNTWTHLAVTYDRVTLRLYINGVQVTASHALSREPSPPRPIRCRSAGTASTGQYFQGHHR